MVVVGARVIKTFITTPLLGGHRSLCATYSNPQDCDFLVEYIYMHLTVEIAEKRMVLPTCSDRIAAIIARCKRVADENSSTSTDIFCRFDGCQRTKKFANKSRLRDHFFCCHLEKKHRCLCGSKFAHACELARHKRTGRAQKLGCADAAICHGGFQQRVVG